MPSIFRRFSSDTRGATAVEYGLLAAMIALGIIVATRSVGTQIGSTLNTTGTAMGNTPA